MRTVLFVEDEPIIRMGLKKYFDWEGLGFKTILEAENGKRGFELAHAHQPDLIITDIRMPIMDGLDMIEKIRQHHLSSQIIILSGYNEFAYAKKAIQFGGVFDYLVKPLQREESMATIERCVRKLSGQEADCKSTKHETDDLSLFKEIKTYIHNQIDQDITLQMIADEFFYNPSYLSRLFKEKLGLNYKDFVKEVKIALAQDLLRDPHLTIAEVARKSGFKTYKHFAKTFKQETEMTPGDFRKQLRG